MPVQAVRVSLAVPPIPSLATKNVEGCSFLVRRGPCPKTGGTAPARGPRHLSAGSRLIAIVTALDTGPSQVPFTLTPRFRIDLGMGSTTSSSTPEEPVESPED